MFVVTGGLIRALSVQRGLLVLRETALERDGEAILLLGHLAADKSTLARYLLEEGWHLLSSELNAVNSDLLVQPRRYSFARFPIGLFPICLKG